MKREEERKRKKAELELVKQGKRPFYLKKCEQIGPLFKCQDFFYDNLTKDRERLGCSTK